MGGGGQQRVSTLSIVEKRSQRPSGCLSVFSRLFDWIKRPQNKKLFSKELILIGESTSSSLSLSSISSVLLFFGSHFLLVVVTFSFSYA